MGQGLGTYSDFSYGFGAGSRVLSFALVALNTLILLDVRSDDGCVVTPTTFRT